MQAHPARRSRIQRDQIRPRIPREVFGLLLGRHLPRLGRGHRIQPLRRFQRGHRRIPDTAGPLSGSQVRPQPAGLAIAGPAHRPAGLGAGLVTECQRSSNSPR